MARHKLLSTPGEPHLAPLAGIREILTQIGADGAMVAFLLNAELRKIVQMDDVRAKFAAQGMEAAGSTPEELKSITEAETAQWARVIKDAHITVN